MHELLPYALPAVGTAASGALWWWRARVRPRRRVSFGVLHAADGGSYALSDFDSSVVLVVVFMSNRCPGVKAYDDRLHDLPGDAPRPTAPLGCSIELGSVSAGLRRGRAVA